ncbi:NYN domain-containing protein [Umezawaea sp. Da 62-37]|uniref:NYN domain-containing protein n=1 Tax=Umezawaea sp. Da 62-37 TaxID=3075927 RepID=UPI0028F6DB7D|nr:NYN domain-containing protein [Umezawaea sp. Da 62-37]WNV91297.1 NYN domain-containing protein [Umezawaea sp. Da 62-37]
MDALPLLVVDSANVVGSVPDGWWRDRAGAAGRLRDSLVAVAANGIDADGAMEVVLVVEGKANRVESVDGVRVVRSPGEGDDTIVGVVRDEGADRRCVVVTADRELRRRVTELGAEVVGPRTVRS